MKNILIPVLLLLLASCTGVKVTNEWDRKVDFKSFKTYSLYPWDKHNDQIVNDYDKQTILSSIKNEMETRDHWELKWGDQCEKGSQLRPHIVWFGEPVDMIGPAVEIVSTADVLIVIGTSMVVYPAASLINYVKDNIPKYYIDPKAFQVHGISNLEIIAKKAGEGVPELMDRLLRQ